MKLTRYKTKKKTNNIEKKINMGFLRYGYIKYGMLCLL